MPDASYRVQFTETALKNIERYPKADQRRILRSIEELAINPYTKLNIKRLVNFDVAYRLRVGRYRVLFDLEDTLKIIDIIDVLPRGKAYRSK